MIRPITTLDGITDDQLRELGDGFITEAGIKAKFSPSHFRNFWKTAMNMGVAHFWAAYNDKQVYGLLGMILSQCPFSGDVIAIEMFWYIHPDHRGSITGAQMFSLASRWAQKVGAKRIIFSSIVQNTAAKLVAFYEHAGFKQLETHFVKNL